MNEIPIIDVAQLSDSNEIINILERGINFSNNLLSADFAQSKIIEFIQLFNSTYRLPLLNCSGSQRESLVYLLLFLKKSIKYTLEELGKSTTNRGYNFKCSLCKEPIDTEPHKNIWNSLQNHHHFEKLYYNFLNNKLDLSVQDNMSYVCENIDKTNIIEEKEPSTSGRQKAILGTSINVLETDENVNNFRFNFSTKYDEAVETKVYPSNMMQSIRRYDKVKEYTIQRLSNTQAVCLICHCEMNGVRITKNMLVGHAMGQRHLKASTNATIIEMLQFYHEFWLKQEPKIQAHQIYFSPYTIPKLRCALCLEVFNVNQVISHILVDPHKKKVIEMFNKKNNIYFLLNLQVQCYDIIEKPEVKEKQSQNRPNFREQRHRGNSDSETPKESRKMANKPSGNDHNIIRAIEKPESTNFIDLLPNRMRVDAKKLKRVSKSGVSTITCDLCMCNLQDNLQDIKKHLALTPRHIALREKYKYYCEICNMSAKSESEWLDHNFKGPRHVNMAETRKASVTEYECTTCKMVIFGDELSLARHMPRDRNGRREKGNRLPDPVKVLFKSKDNIIIEGEHLVEQANEVLTTSITRDCCAKIELALSEQFENCRVYPFGSRISGIGTKNSDLDVFVDTGNMYYGEQNQEPVDQVGLIRLTLKVLSKNKEYANFVQVLTARTPILKLHHIPTKLDSDLSFKHGLSVENTKFLKFCLELQPITQPLILLVKKWAEHIMFESITTYALAIMCIFYLQVNKFLLSVEKLREINKKESKTICGWRTIAYTLTLEEMKQHIKTYPNTLYELLKDFFSYYAKFDFNTYVVCPLLGQLVKKSLFSENDGQELPKEMFTYIAQLDSEDPEIFRSTAFMCIQDPFDLSHNLTKAVQQGTVTKFQNMCKLSVTHLQSIK